MALNIPDLARMCEFNFELKSLGAVRCLSLNSNHISLANKKLEESGVQSIYLVRWLFGEMVRRSVVERSNEDDSTDAHGLTEEELKLVADEELEEFSDKLIQNNKYLLKNHKGSDIEKSSDESACDFLVRAFRNYADKRSVPLVEMINSVSKPIFSSTTLGTIKRNLELSDQLQATIDKYTRGHSLTERMFAEEKERRGHMTQPVSNMSEPLTQRNPIHETNEKLECVVKQIEDLRPMAAQAAQIIRSMNDTALDMQADYIGNSVTAGQQTRIAIWIAAVSLLVSAIGLAISSFFSYQSYVDVKESGVKNDVQIKAFQGEIRDLVAVQREERAAIVKAIVDASSVPAAAVKK